MVYANYTPAKLPTILSDAERAVLAVTSPETLEIIGKLIYNAAISPKEEKFRRIKLSNAKIQATIVNTPGALDLLLALGWVNEEMQVEEGSESFLVIPSGKYMSMADYRMIETQKENARREASKATAEIVRRAAQAQQPQAQQA